MSCDHELAHEWARCSGKTVSYITNYFINFWLSKAKEAKYIDHCYSKLNSIHFKKRHQLRVEKRYFFFFWFSKEIIKMSSGPIELGRVRLGSIRNKNNWNNASKFGSYSHSGIPGFPFRLFYSQEQNSRNIFRNIFRNKFLFRNIPNERALTEK